MNENNASLTICFYFTHAFIQETGGDPAKVKLF